MLAEMRDRAVKSYHLDIGKARKEGRLEGITEGLEEGRATGQAELLNGMLSAKFGPLPPAVVERLQRASKSELFRRGTKFIVAESLDAVFDDG